MAWAKLDDGFHDHPKVDELSLAAVGLWTLTLTAAHRHRRTATIPGHIAASRVQKIAGKQAHGLASELVRVGLWEIETSVGGWLIHDFADYLPKERDADERAAAGRKGAASRWQGHGKKDGKPDGKLPDDSMASGMANDGSRASAPAFPSRPVPSSGSVGGERSEPLRQVGATNPPTCTAHPNGNATGPCTPCRKVREWNDRADERFKREEAERAANCVDCHGTNWVEDSTGKPIRKCGQHRWSA